MITKLKPRNALTKWQKFLDEQEIAYTLTHPKDKYVLYIGEGFRVCFALDGSLEWVIS